ncbi:hypothetical protein DSCW_06490 [Desulfosarcina widdelii]|uniref:DNA binding HTH domain-containing protein n=1 Tax=Desulfosarcina widdelii TaxID=947919 RepID=A0A5K7YTY2_9BACT|nr:helix-turn-helix domain-containing protein [Desulfosarcina widdelii]BBO73232.1 hypothetical protein DSCW_06490 [Desulfosarcina widdelii]
MVISELKNMTKLEILLSDDSLIDSEWFGAGGMDKDFAGEDSSSEPVLLKKAVEEAEKNAIRRALRLAEGNRSKATVFLGMSIKR